MRGSAGAARTRGFRQDTGSITDNITTIMMAAKWRMIAASTAASISTTMGVTGMTNPQPPATKKSVGVLGMLAIAVGVGAFSYYMLDGHTHTCAACGTRWRHLGAFNFGDPAAHRCSRCGTIQWWKDGFQHVFQDPRYSTPPPERTQPAYGQSQPAYGQPQPAYGQPYGQTPPQPAYAYAPAYSPAYSPAYAAGPYAAARQEIREVPRAALPYGVPR